MDLSTIMGTLLGADSVSSVSQQTGIPADNVSSILTSALPYLLSGANQQANNASTAQGFLTALQDHGAEDTSNISSFLGNADTVDGAKIISHLLGASESSATNAAAKKAGASKADTAKVLAIVAPLLMALIGKNAKKRKEEQAQQQQADASAAIMNALLSGNDNAALISSLLGVSAAPATTSSSKKKKPAASSSNMDTLSAAATLLGNLLK